MAAKEATASAGQDKEKKYAPIQHKPCQICEGKATGYHFGVISCEACKSFFRRSLKRKKEPLCEKDGNCTLRTTEVVGIPCPACRFKRCVQKGMSEISVKKGRYSLDRRADAILESRQFWRSDHGQNVTVKGDVSASSTSPSQDAVTSTGSPGHETGNGSPTALLSPPVDTSITSLSADDFFTMLSEVVGDDLGKIPSVSAANSASPSTFLNTANPLPQLHHNTNPDIHNIQPLLEPSSSYPQGQFTFNLEPRLDLTQDSTEPLQDLVTDPSFLPGSQIKLENPSNQSCSGFGLSHQSVNPHAHRSVQPSKSQDGIVQPTEKYTGTENTNLINGTANSRELASGGRSKQQEPEDMDILCKLLMSDFKVKDDQDYIIDEIVAAFDRQNFTNKGFLAKVSDQQHKYLEGQKEEERMFGPVTKLSSEEFIQMFKETGVDLDGRLAIMQGHADVLDGWVKQVMQFYKGIPGFTDLPLKDQMHLIKGSKWEFSTSTYFAHIDVHNHIQVSPFIQGSVIDMKLLKAVVPNTDDLVDHWIFLIVLKFELECCAYFPLMDIKNRLFASPYIPGEVFDMDLLKALFQVVDDHFIDIWIEVMERLQNLQITDREYTMMTALFVIEPEECVTEKGKIQCKQLAGKLDDAFRHLLKKRLTYDKTDEIMKNIKDIRDLLRPISQKYNTEYFTSMKMYSEQCGIKYGELTWQYYEM